MRSGGAQERKELPTMRVLITGISGFVGSHLANYLQTLNIETWGVDLPGRPTEALAGGRDGQVLCGSIQDEAFLKEALIRVQPSHVFHFAGVLGGAKGGNSIQYDVNVLGTVKLLETLRAVSLSPLVFINSSSAVYGRSAANPIGEEQVLCPITAYAASKAAQEMAAIHYYQEYQLPVIRARTFNLVGPRQPPTLAVSAIARQVAQAERGGARVIRVGNLFPRRDYTDVRDAVAAYWLLAKQGQSGEVYNICSGRSYSIQECVEQLMGVARGPLTVEVDPARQRITAEINEQVGSAARVYQATGWKATIPFEQSLHDVLETWRSTREL
jgi:GDP-4-dehydro-6-deoxy-D-mannose reductase